VNHLDCFCCIVIMLHLIANLYFNNAEFIATEEAKHLDLLLFSIDAIGIIAISGLFIVTVTERLFQKKSIDAMTSAVSRTFLSLQLEVRGRRDDFLRAVDEYEASEAPAAADVSFEAFSEAMIESLKGSAIVPSRSTLHTIFFILKLIHSDDDEHSLFMSPALRKELASDEGVPKSLVRFDSCLSSCSSLSPLALSSRLSLGLSLACDFVCLSAVFICRVAVFVLHHSDSRDLSLQVLGYLGKEEEGQDGSLSAQKSQRLSTRRKTSIVAEKVSSTVAPAGAAVAGGSSGWHISRINEVARKICWEIAQSLKPRDLYKWVEGNRNDESKMSSLFSFSAW
jgi:hypothetical protein